MDPMVKRGGKGIPGRKRSTKKTLVGRRGCEGGAHNGYRGQIVVKGQKKKIREQNNNRGGTWALAETCTESKRKGLLHL